MPRHMPIKELDLSLVGSNGYQYGSATNITDRMNAVPGFKTSAAFFTFLRANLVLPPSTLNSTSSTPLLDPSSSQTLPPLTPSCLATMTIADPEETITMNPLDSVPPLTTTVLVEESDKVAALKLVADSVAQQRQIASRAIIFHPLTIAIYILALAVVNQYLYKTRGDLGIVVTTCAGLTMIGLVAVRGATGAYLTMAEEVSWKFVENEDGEEDTIIGSRYGDEIIGALILRLERTANSAGSPRKRKPSRGGNGVIRAWTTRLRYRGTGVGTELLEEAVKVSRERLGNPAEVGFAAEHANSKMILPELFNGGFRKGEVRAAKALEHVLENMETSVRKKR
ncbi:acetyltransferase [Phlyctema vagabunda]|uniref:Acetyltransferase n=1 Tax=Phlyctema vagabunda TaxID=108571 RepID=A0ABR4PV43_9HELO